MMGETQSLFPEENLTIAFGEKDADSVRYFDLVAENSAPAKSENTGTLGQGIFVNRSGRPRRAARPNSPPLAPPFSGAGGDSKELLDILFFYLEQIIHLSEISEIIEKLEVAVRAGNIDELNLLARDCADRCAECGMWAAIAPLLRLERLRGNGQLPTAATLCERARKEFERFRFNLGENLERIKSAVNRAAGS